MHRLPISIAKPISRAEFLNALYKTLDLTSTSNVRQNGTRHVRLGLLISDAHLARWTVTHLLIVSIALAISGGVDSMALAGLCAQACKSQTETGGNQVNFSFTPLIVDHRLRPESTDEAEVTSKRVQKLLGILTAPRARILGSDAV